MTGPATAMSELKHERSDAPAQPGISGGVARPSRACARRNSRHDPSRISRSEEDAGYEHDSDQDAQHQQRRPVLAGSVPSAPRTDEPQHESAQAGVPDDL